MLNRKTINEKRVNELEDLLKDLNVVRTFYEKERFFTEILSEENFYKGAVHGIDNAIAKIEKRIKLIRRLNNENK